MVNQLIWSAEKGLFLRRIKPSAFNVSAHPNPLTEEAGTDTFERMPAINLLPDKLKQVWMQLLSARDHNDVYDTMDRAVHDIPGFKEDPEDPLTHYYQNFKITQGLSMHLDHEVDSINYANTQRITAAPSLVVAARLNTGHTFMLTQRDHAWVPFSKNQQLVTPIAQQKFLAEMKKLADQGYVHAYGAKGDAHWFVNPEKGQLMLNVWSSLRPLEWNETPDSIAAKFQRTLSGT